MQRSWRTNGGKMAALYCYHYLPLLLRRRRRRRLPISANCRRASLSQVWFMMYTHLTRRQLGPVARRLATASWLSHLTGGFHTTRANHRPTAHTLLLAGDNVAEMDNTTNMGLALMLWMPRRVTHLGSCSRRGNARHILHWTITIHARVFLSGFQYDCLRLS